MSELPRRACWKAEDARCLLHVGALGADKQSFLATHLPIEGFSVFGPESPGIAEKTEVDLLRDLSKPERRHGFCVVEGEPGSGKSHLIRWLNVAWPEQQGDLVLLVQRLDGSLQGTLEQLRKVLPAEHQSLFKYIGRTQNLSIAGRARNFQSTLINALNPGQFEKDFDDGKWCADNKLADWLRHPALDAWTAPRRIIELLSGAQTRDQAVAHFQLADIAELEQILRPHETPARALVFSRKLQHEAVVIRELTPESYADAAARERLRQNLPNSHRLLDALNLRRNGAVQNVLGISSQALKQMFAELRRLLAPRRLVLLLEDITAWEGIDNQLIDVLVTSTEENPELCPMVSVVGLTPLYLEEAQGFHANYQQRIGVRVRLGDEEDGNQIQEVSTLRSTTAQVRFVANYLRAARAGQEALQQWDGDPETLPNTCTHCGVREGCHRAFGVENNIGLFPFNRRAVEQLYAALTPRDRRSTLQTPRGMIQGVLAPTLLAPHDLEAGAYPSQQLFSDYIPTDRQRLLGNARDIIEAKATDAASKDRLSRLVLFWGSSQVSELRTTRDIDTDELYFAGMPKGLFDALGVSWPGAAEVGPTPPASSPESNSLAQSSQGDAEPPKDPAPEVTQRRGAGVTRRTQPGTNPATPQPAQLRRLAKDIDDWSHGDNPGDRTGLNNTAYAVLERLPWGTLGVPQWVRRRLFTPQMVLLEGTGQIRQHFVLPRERWVARGLTAYAELRARGDELDPPETNSHQRAYARMQIELKRLVREHIAARMPRLADGSPWDPAATAAQVLLARAILRGAVPPEADAVEHWRILVSAETEAASAPKDRVPSWGEALEKTQGSHAKIREVLLALINCPQDFTKIVPSTVNPGACAKAMLAMRSDLKLADFPAALSTPGQALAELEKISQCASEVAKRLPRLPHLESERLRQRAQEIDALLQGASLYARVERLDKAISAVAGRLPQAAPPAVMAWRQSHQGLKTRGVIDPNDRRLQDRLEDFVDEVVAPQPPGQDESPLNLLAWALRAPASEISTTLEALRTGEKTVADLLEFLDVFVASSGSGAGSLNAIHAAGQRITDVSTKAISALDGRS